MVLAPSKLHLGEELAGRYVIECLLGRGSMGAVYKAHDNELGEAVALKAMTEEKVGPQASERFRREVRLARKVTHRNVARTHDIGVDDGLLFFTMEVIEGESLDARLRQIGRLEVTEALRIAREIAEGLSAAHQVGVIHRDLKPGNIMLEVGGRVVITDFGIARPSEVENDGVKTVGAVGTPSYMAPEQCYAQPVDGRADIYALGGILFEMLTGELPFHEETPIATAMARLNSDPPDPRGFAQLPDAVADLTLTCLSRRREERPETAATLARLISQLEDAPLQQVSTDVATAAMAIPTELGTRGSDVSLSTFAAQPALAVLPFKYQGPRDDEYLADSLTDEVIDLLSMTSGLRVFARGAVERFRDDRDPSVVGRALGANALVDATVQRSRTDVRISARLIDTNSGEQVWSERTAGRFEDLFELQDSMSRRVAEALRVELHSRSNPGQVSPDALELYYQARARLRLGNVRNTLSAVELLEECLELAPNFPSAISAHAIACTRAWFFKSFAPDRDTEAATRTSVARALQEAAHLAETHLAAAMMSVQVGDFREAVSSGRRALKTAPTFAHAHEYLGMLECEAGRGERGEARLRLAMDLDPTTMLAPLWLARKAALAGDIEGYDAMIDGMVDRGQGGHSGLVGLEMRVGCWTADMERVRRAMDVLSADTEGAAPLLRHYGAFLLGDIPVEAADSFITGMLEAEATSGRFKSMVGQQVAEVACANGRPDLGMRYLGLAADSLLIDLDWIEHCPAIEPLRSMSEFAAARETVLVRAKGIWGV